MLRLFDKSYRKGDPKIMKVWPTFLTVSPNSSLTLFVYSPQHCAQTLLEFNGGASCVQIYVNQHDFFISKSRVNETTTIEETHLLVFLYFYRLIAMNLFTVGGRFCQIQMQVCQRETLAWLPFSRTFVQLLARKHKSSRRYFRIHQLLCKSFCSECSSNR